MKMRIAMGTGMLAALAFASNASAEGSDRSAAGEQQQHQQQVQQQASVTADQSHNTSPAAQQGEWGLSNQQVRQLQQKLLQQGFYEGNVDGIVGPLTRQALRSFQQQQGIDAAGTWNQSTAEALGIQSERQPVSGRDSTRDTTGDITGKMGSAGTDVQRQPGMDQPSMNGSETAQGTEETQRFQLSALSSEQVQDLQQRLKGMGHYQGEVDGVVGPQTRAALRRFFQEQIQLANQGMLSDAAIGVFGMTPEEIQPVSGQDQPGEAQSADDY
jgi:peptidoglycan hydrolase-like protein with peptidoglycan-binding domain